MVQVEDGHIGELSVAVNIPLGQWHSVEVLESGTVILECKDGPWEPLGERDVLERQNSGREASRIG